MTEREGALAGIRILDLTDERGIYGAKLLADLGADVVRPEPPDGDPLRARGPHVEEPRISLWHAFFASNRRFFTVDPLTDAGKTQLQRLVDAADIVLTCSGAFAVVEADLDAAQARLPALVVVEMSSFGSQGPWRDFLAPDLVAGALGGSVATTGDADTTPLKTFGELNFIVAGAYGAVAALGALFHARETGEGQYANVSVHECIASCLEHVFMWYLYEDRLMFADAPGVPRQASLHWSKAYKVMAAKGGSIMVTPTPNFDTQLAWLIEENAHEDLIDPKYMEPENRREFARRMMEVLEAWVATKDVEQLFFEAQSRHCPFGWVLPIDSVATNPQLEARDWWVQMRAEGLEIRAPGAPYQFSETPWAPGEYRSPESDTEAVLNDIGWAEGAR